MVSTWMVLTLINNMKKIKIICITLIIIHEDTPLIYSYKTVIGLKICFRKVMKYSCQFLFICLLIVYS